MFKNIFFAFGTIVIFALGVTLLPINRINWGRISILPAATITVTGTSEGQVANQVASFGATVTVSNSDKTTAVNSVNTKMTALLKSLKDFGIPDADIKTESVNVYQMPVPVPQAQTMMYPSPPQQTGNGDWQATNSITVTLRDVTKVSALTDLLNKSGATNLYGPNLTVDSQNMDDSALLVKAMADARKKAESIAKSSGQSLGPVINVQEGGGNYPMPLYATASKDSMMGTLSAPVQTGTSTLSKSVTVVYELR